MSSAELFLHIGLHKTGTTFLQRAVFPHWPDIDYLGKPYAKNHLEEWIHRPTSKALISNEQLSSAPVGAFLVEGRERWAEHRVRCLERLHVLFPDAAILLGVRSQAGFVLSLYSQYISFGGNCDIEAFWTARISAGPLAGEDLLLVPVIDKIGSMWRRVFIFALEEFSPPRRNALFADMAGFFGVSTQPIVSPDGPINAKVPQEIADELQSQIRNAPASMTPDELRSQLRRTKEYAKAAGWFSPWRGGTEMCLPPNMHKEIDQFYTDDWKRTCETMARLRSPTKIVGAT